LSYLANCVMMLTESAKKVNYFVGVALTFISVLSWYHACRLRTLKPATTKQSKSRLDVFL